MKAPAFLLFSGNSARHLISEMAQCEGIESGDVEIVYFADGEIQPRYKQSIRGKDVCVVQSTFPPSDNIMELLLLIDAARRASASKITAVIPYFGYARQDRKDQPRVSFGSKLFANILTTSGADRVVTMDLHAAQIQGFFDIPLDNLEASAVFVPFLKDQQIDDLVIASPDTGGVKRARVYASHLNADLVIVDKERLRAGEVKRMQIIGEVSGKNVWIIDDMIDTAGTLCSAAELIMEQGATSVNAIATHALFSKNAVERIDKSSLHQIYVTNTIPDRSKSSAKIKYLSIAPIFAEALKKIHNFESVSSLFVI